MKLETTIQNLQNQICWRNFSHFSSNDNQFLTVKRPTCECLVRMCGTNQACHLTSCSQPFPCVQTACSVITQNVQKKVYNLDHLAALQQFFHYILATHIMIFLRPPFNHRTIVLCQSQFLDMKSHLLFLESSAVKTVLQLAASMCEEIKPPGNAF